MHRGRSPNCTDYRVPAPRARRPNPPPSAGPDLSDTRDIIPYQNPAPAAPAVPRERVTARPAPAIVRHAGPAAEFAWGELFQGELANPHTRKDYIHAAHKFLDGSQGRSLDLIRIAPGDVDEYLQELPVAVPTKKRKATRTNPRSGGARSPGRRSTLTRDLPFGEDVRVR